jgi:TrmH family RNA methyltransferase
LSHSDLDDLIVVLVRPRNPLNIGAAARAMSNFGCRSLRLVNPYKLAFRDARSAMGGSEILKTAEEFSSVADAIADCVFVVGTAAIGDRAVTQPVHLLDQQTGNDLRDELQQGRVALLFGSEKTGLSNKDFSYCRWLLKIPTSDQNISMNLGQAVAVCLYELAKSGASQSAIPVTDLASAGDLENITQCLMESLRISGYVKPGTDELFEKKARQLLVRLELGAYDAKLLLGMLRQILWKLRHPTTANV